MATSDGVEYPFLNDVGILNAAGAYLSTFSDHYARTHRAKGKKNLRCFPSCRKDGHRASGYCGSPAIVSASIEWDQSIFVTEPRVFVFAEFRPIEDAMDDTLARVQKSWVLKHCRTRNDFMKRFIKGVITSRAVREKEGNRAELSVTVEFNGRENMGWHYYWNSGRYKNATRHSMRCYVMVEECERHQDPEDPWLLMARCISSPPFSIGTHGHDTATKSSNTYKIAKSLLQRNNPKEPNQKCTPNPHGESLKSHHPNLPHPPTSGNIFKSGSGHQELASYPQQRQTQHSNHPPATWHRPTGWSTQGYMTPEAAVTGSGGYLKPDIEAMDNIMDDDTGDGTSIFDDIGKFGGDENSWDYGKTDDDLTAGFSMSAERDDGSVGSEPEVDFDFSSSDASLLSKFSGLTSIIDNISTSSLGQDGPARRRKAGETVKTGIDLKARSSFGRERLQAQKQVELESSGSQKHFHFTKSRGNSMNAETANFSLSASSDVNKTNFSASSASQQLSPFGHIPTADKNSSSLASSSYLCDDQSSSFRHSISQQNSSPKLMLSSISSLAISDRSTPSASSGPSPRENSLRILVSPLHWESSETLGSTRNLVSSRSNKSVQGQKERISAPPTPASLDCGVNFDSDFEEGLTGGA